MLYLVIEKFWYNGLEIADTMWNFENKFFIFSLFCRVHALLNREDSFNHFLKSRTNDKWKKQYRKETKTGKTNQMETRIRFCHNLLSFWKNKSQQIPWNQGRFRHKLTCKKRISWYITLQLYFFFEHLIERKSFFFLSASSYLRIDQFNLDRLLWNLVLSFVRHQLTTKV